MTRFCTCAGLASPGDLSRKRKQVTETSCKTCGRPLVDGIGHPSATMLSTVSLELTNFINTGLTWKTVKKGVRSASRRSRKPARSLDVGVQQNNKSTKREDSSVSESEKLGVAVLGRRFADKVEHIPHKKRKPALQSQSPSPRTPSPLHEEALSSQPLSTSPRTEDSDQSIDSEYTSGRLCWSNSVSNREMGQLNGPVAGQPGQDVEGGFVDRELSDVNKKLGYAEDFSGIALLAAAACDNSIIDDALNIKKVPVVEEFSIAEGIDSSSSASSLERTTSSEMSSLLFKDSADADNIKGSSFQDTSMSLSQDLRNKGDCGEKRPFSKKDVRLHWDLNTFVEEWEVPFVDDGVPDDSTHGERTNKLEDGAIHRDAAETYIYTQTVSIPVSEEKINTSSTKVMHKREVGPGTSARKLDKSVATENVDLGKHDLVVLDLPVTEKAMREIGSMQAKEDKTSCLSDNGTSSTELISTITCRKSDVEYSVNKSGEASPSHPSPEHGNFSKFGTAFGESQPVAPVDVGEKQDKAAPMDSSFHVEQKKLMSKSALSDHTNLRYGSDNSYADHDHVLGVRKMTEFPAGYESPFEDGELRDSLDLSFEEIEIEGETKCVDYDSDNRDPDDFDTANRCLSDGYSGSGQNVDSGSLGEKVEQHGRVNVLKESSHLVSSERSSSQDKLPEANDVANDVYRGKILATDSMDGLNAKGSLVWEVGFASSKPNTVYTPRSRSGYDSYFGAGREFGPEKSFGRDRTAPRIQDGSRGNDLVDSSAGYRDSINRYPSDYHDPQDTGHFRPRRGIANTHHDQRRPLNYASKGVYRPFIRRRSPAECDDGNSVERENGNFRSRGGYRINRLGGGFRGPREEYRGPISDDHQPLSSVRWPRYFPNRKRNFSPVVRRGGAGFSRPQRKSPSRSRSPVPWHLQRERNIPRRFSRSPDFRPNARIERTARMPFRKRNFEENGEDDFMSPPRRRWTNDWNFVGARFRERESPPGRVFGQNHRFDSVGSQRMKSDDHFRPGFHPRRFTEGYKNSGNDFVDRAKNGNRCEMINRRRPRYDAEDGFEGHNEGTVRRDMPRSAGGPRGSFQYNNEKIYDSGPKTIRSYEDDVDASPVRE